MQGCCRASRPRSSIAGWFCNEHVCRLRAISIADPGPNVYDSFRDAFLKLPMQPDFSRTQMLASYPIEIRAGVAAPSCEAARTEPLRRHSVPGSPRG